MKRDPKWMQALRTEVARTTITQAARKLSFSRTTISLVLAGKYPGRTQHIEAKVRERLMARAARRPQLRTVDPELHAELKRLVDLWGAEYVGRWCATTPLTLLAHLRGTSAEQDARDFAEQVRRLGLPKRRTCRLCGGIEYGEGATS